MANAFVYRYSLHTHTKCASMHQELCFLFSICLVMECWKLITRRRSAVNTGWMALIHCELCVTSTHNRLRKATKIKQMKRRVKLHLRMHNSCKYIFHSCNVIPYSTLWYRFIEKSNGLTLTACATESYDGSVKNFIFSLICR